MEDITKEISEIKDDIEAIKLDLKELLEVAYSNQLKIAEIESEIKRQ